MQGRRDGATFSGSRWGAAGGRLIANRVAEPIALFRRAGIAESRRQTGPARRHYQAFLERYDWPPASHDGWPAVLFPKAGSDGQRYTVHMKQLYCRDLKPGDILLRMATESFTHRLIQFGQALVGQPNAFLAHAAIALDTQFAIEAQKAGVTANHLAMKNKDCGYYVYRCTNPRLAQGAATSAKRPEVVSRDGGFR